MKKKRRILSAALCGMMMVSSAAPLGVPVYAAETGPGVSIQTGGTVSNAPETMPQGQSVPAEGPTMDDGYNTSAVTGGQSSGVSEETGLSSETGAAAIDLSDNTLTQTDAEKAAWDAERAALNLTRSIAGTVKPWLFYKDAYNERQVLFERGKQLWWYKKMISEKLYQPLKENGIRLVLMIVPDKETLYGLDYLPDDLKAPLEKEDRIDQFLQYMAQEFPELEIYHPEAEMLAAKAQGLPLYYASDSHWNFVGAGVCAEGLMNYLGSDYALSEKPAITYRRTGETNVGDLQEFEGLSGDASFNRVEYAAEGMWPAEKTYTQSDGTGEEVYAIYRSTDQRALPKKLYFCGDSYRWYIQYLLNGQFEESYFVQRYQFSAQDAIAHKPDVFIYEIPERFLPQLGSLIG